MVNFCARMPLVPKGHPCVAAVPIKTKKITSFVILIGLVVGLGFFVLQNRSAIFAQGADATPPDITEVKYKMLSASSVEITWKTNEKSDSMINYGLEKDYGVLRNPTASTTNHRIVIPEVLSGTQYFFRVISSDGGNNQAISADYSFTASGTRPTPPSLASPGPTPTPTPRQQAGTGEQISVSDDILKIIEAITDPDLLAAIAARIEKIAERLFKPPFIVGIPTIEIGTDYALFGWETDKESNSLVAIAAEGEYDLRRENPYTFRQGEPYEEVIKHSVRVIGLQPATTYHYQISSQERIGPAGQSADKTFKTKSVLPEIRSVTLKKVEEYSATLAWLTSVPTSALVEYTNLKTKQVKSVGNPTYVTAHTQQLTNLEFKTTYSAMVIAENEAGERVESRLITFTTSKDEFPPVISRVTNESTLYPGEEIKIQTIIGWETDEPSMCQFFYFAGIGAIGAKAESFLAEANPTAKHVQVITAFQPATIYKFWLECKDVVGNKARSSDFVLFTPQKEKSILDVIIENFGATFGWVKNIGK